MNRKLYVSQTKQGKEFEQLHNQLQIQVMQNNLYGFDYLSNKNYKFELNINKHWL